MSYLIPSVYSTQIPTAEATGQLTSEWSRNPAKYPVNRWTEVRPVTKSIGYYLRIAPDFAARSAGAAGSRHLWKDGADRPNGVSNQITFEWQPFRAQRYDYDSTVGDMALDQSEVQIGIAVQRGLMSQCMVDRTRFAIAALTGANFGGNTAAVNGGLLPSGQNWLNGTSGGNTPTNNIKTSILQAMNSLMKSTGGGIDMEDLILLISPDLAVKMAVSPEITSVPIQSQYAYDALTGTGKFNAKWGLPDRLASGIRLVVEDTVINTAPLGSNSPAMGYGLDSHTAYLLVRPGLQPVQPGVLSEDGVPLVNKDGDSDAPAISSVTGFFLEENNLEIFNDPKHRRTEMHVVSNFQYVASNPLGMFKFTAVDQ